MTALGKNKMYSYLDQLSTQELEELLRKDGEAPDGGDLDMVMYIMEVIEQREIDNNTAEKDAATHALEEFYSVYNIPEGDNLQLYLCDNSEVAKDIDNVKKVKNNGVHRKHSVRKILLIAAVLICLSSFLVCTAVGFERVFQMIGKWTSEVFVFDTGMMSNGSNNLDPSASQYATIEDALAAHGIKEKIIPSTPEGYQISYVNVTTSSFDERTEFCELMQCGDEYIVIQVSALSQPASISLEKDENMVAKEVYGGITHYFYQNKNSNCVTWSIEDIICVIDTSLSQEELQSIVKSIYDL